MGCQCLTFVTMLKDQIKKIPSSDTNKQTLFILTWLSDFVLCGTSLYICRRVSISQVKCNRKLRFSM